jgi:hypothetical protein
MRKVVADLTGHGPAGVDFPLEWATALREVADEVETHHFLLLEKLKHEDYGEPFEEMGKVLADGLAETIGADPVPLREIRAHAARDQAKFDRAMEVVKPARPVATIPFEGVAPAPFFPLEMTEAQRAAVEKNLDWAMGTGVSMAELESLRDPSADPESVVGADYPAWIPHESFLEKREREQPYGTPILEERDPETGVTALEAQAIINRAAGAELDNITGVLEVPIPTPEVAHGVAFKQFCDHLDRGLHDLKERMHDEFAARDGRC